MIHRFAFAVFLSVVLTLMASCGAAPDHPFMDDIPEIIPAVPAEETFVFKCDEYDIAVNVETMLPYHFFGYSEGLFQVCYDAGSHSDHGGSCLNVGFIDTSGNVVIPLEYRQGGLYSEGLVLLTTPDLKYGFADANGELVIPLEYSYANGFNEDGLAIVGKFDADGSTIMEGVINKNGEVVLLSESGSLLHLKNNLVLFVESRQDSSWYGVMNLQGEIIIPAEYDFIYLNPDDDLIYAQTGGMPYYENKDRKHGFFDAEGNVVIPVELEYMHVGMFYDGLAYVMALTDDYIVNEYNNNAPVAISGYIDKTGELVIPMEYNAANNFINGLAMVSVYENPDINEDMLYGFIDTEGNIAVPIEYAYAGEFSEGLAAVGIKTETGIKYGYVNKKGEVVIPFAYDAAEMFLNGFAWVESGGSWGMINSIGEVVIPFMYRSYVIVSGGLIAVKSDDLWGLIDFSGKVVVPGFYDRINTFAYGLTVVEKNGKFGVINTNGDIIVPLEYDEIQHFDDYFIVKTDGLRGIWKLNVREG